MTGGATPTTRELLDAIGGGGTRLPEDEARSPRVRRFIRWTLGVTLLAMVLLGSASWWLDPLGATSRTTRFVAVENDEVAVGKLDLIDNLDAAPEVLVLGSSRSMKLDPADIAKVTGGNSAFNAAISGGRMRDALLYAAYADAAWGSEDFPHLVLGVANGVLRERTDEPGDPRFAELDLGAILAEADAEAAGREDEGLVERVRDNLDMWRTLLSMEALEAAARAARREVRADGWGVLLEPVPEDGEAEATGADGGTSDGKFDARGMQLFDPFWADRGMPERVEAQMTDFINRSFPPDDTFTGADEAAVDDFVAMVRLANANGDVPTVWITPFHPRALELLPPEAAERDEVFRAALDELAAREDLEFTLLDPDAPGGPALAYDDWHDGIHMTPANTRRIVEWLQAEGALAPRGG